ncbi:hypothetical protein K438DRAFT_203503 [Mycena galopus ATCC 62051]|nr:hypothetical protein K438DRAFT_203503 [Mycena galopus ATCC 62051]
MDTDGKCDDPRTLPRTRHIDRAEEARRQKTEDEKKVRAPTPTRPCSATIRPPCLPSRRSDDPTTLPRTRHERCGRRRDPDPAQNHTIPSAVRLPSAFRRADPDPPSVPSQERGTAHISYNASEKTRNENENENEIKWRRPGPHPGWPARKTKDKRVARARWAPSVSETRRGPAPTNPDAETDNERKRDSRPPPPVATIRRPCA